MRCRCECAERLGSQRQRPANLSASRLYSLITGEPQSLSASGMVRDQLSCSKTSQIAAAIYDLRFARPPRTTASSCGSRPEGPKIIGATNLREPPRGNPRASLHRKPRHGEVSEWLKEHAWKACSREIVTWVRIPPSPPVLLFSLHAVSTFRFFVYLWRPLRSGKSMPSAPYVRLKLLLACGHPR